MEHSRGQDIPESALGQEVGIGEGFRLLMSVAGPLSAEAVETDCRTFLTLELLRLDMKGFGFGVEIGGRSFGTGSSWVGRSLLVGGRLLLADWLGCSPARPGWVGSCDRILRFFHRCKLFQSLSQTIRIRWWCWLAVLGTVCSPLAVEEGRSG